MALKALFPTPESLEPFKTHVDILISLLFFVARNEPPTLETLLLKRQINHLLNSYEAPYGYRIGDQWLIASYYNKHYDLQVLDYLITGRAGKLFACEPEKGEKSSLTYIEDPELLVYLFNSAIGADLPLSCINRYGDNIMHHVLSTKQLHTPELLGHPLMKPFLDKPNRAGSVPIDLLSQISDLPIGFLHTFFAKNPSAERRLLMEEIRKVNKKPSQMFFNPQAPGDALSLDTDAKTLLNWVWC